MLDGIFYPLRTGYVSRGHFKWFRLPPAKKEFQGIVPRRSMGERTFSWLSQSRQRSKEYERLCETSEVMVYAAMSRIMVRRLARS
jgi:putative transposase